jgi:hypothetical protein
VSPSAFCRRLTFPIVVTVRSAGETPSDVAHKCGQLHRFASAGVSLLPAREDFDAVSVPGLPPVAPRFSRPPAEASDVDPPRPIDSINRVYVWERLSAVSQRSVVSTGQLYPPQNHRWPLSYLDPIPPSTFASEKQALSSMVPDFVCLPYVSTATRLPDGLVLSVVRSSTLSKESSVIVSREILERPPKQQSMVPVLGSEQPPGTTAFKIPRVTDWKPVFTVGREPPASHESKCRAVKMPDVRCSKIHAVIRYCPSTLMFEVADVGSANGTWVNGCRLSATKESSPWCPLYDGATIMFGSVLGCVAGWLVTALVS